MKNESDIDFIERMNKEYCPDCGYYIDRVLDIAEVMDPCEKHAPHQEGKPYNMKWNRHIPNSAYKTQEDKLSELFYNHAGQFDGRQTTMSYSEFISTINELKKYTK